ncbi:nuclear transport factor 2 family protein [Brevundimonas staleyi]|uniref:Nuclear transport factor 2 family protein n=1 Tax=Brevundimonas staleyi TaxID=74326 RepID=A0ABW0FW62_9CAUL
MSLSLLFAAALQTAALTTTPADPASAEAQAVMVPVDAVFAAIAARDGALATPHFDDDARLTAATTNRHGLPAVTRMSAADFAGNLTPAAPPLEEVMPDPIIAIDGDVAMVWGRYVFRIDGAISHCGSNHFDLVRRDGVWKIANLTWNQRKDGCA